MRSDHRAGHRDEVSADELTGHQVLLDVRWTLAGGADRPGYLAGHLPGARFVDLDTELAAPAHSFPGAGRHPLPDPAELELTWRRLGLAEDSDVVVYDAIDGTAAVRAWWLLRWSGLPRVRVLAGGLSGWAGPLETGEPEPPPRGTLVVRPGGMPVVDADGASAGPLLDARAAARYRGEVEPMDPVAGHIPGAVNLPYSQLYLPDGTLRSDDELAAVFGRAGVSGDVPVVASCGSGVTACHLILAGRAIGLDLALYPGSYSGWCDLRRPVATG